MRQTLSDSSRYRAFVSDRDLALERIHQHVQVDLSRILFEALENVERLTAALSLKAEGSFTQAHVLLSRMESGVQEIFQATFPLLVKRILSMRKATYVLTYASEQEAIGRATKKPEPRIGKDSFKVGLQKAISAPTLMGPVEQRTWHALMQLRQRICSAFLSALLGPEKKPEKIMARVKQAFPPIQVYSRPPRALSKLIESDDKIDKKDWFDLDFIDEDDWDMAVDAYETFELPANRFDNSATWDPDSGVMKYNWELEQEVTEDFVRQARDGQIQAARDLGVQDFVWVAILDAKTCDDCCAPRNGKTTKEIEQMDDDCDAAVPPAHFSCRCQVSPVASVDEVEGPDWESFNDWLNT